MLAAFALALGQLADPRVERIIARSLLATLGVFAVLGAGLWWGLKALIAAEPQLAAAGNLLAALAVFGLGWLLWRIIALLVIELYADQVVGAVEARHYPAAAATARNLGWHEELGAGLAGAGRALLFNLLALPLALALLITGVGAPLVFLGVNAVLLGRELQDMVWLRHRPSPTAPPPLSRGERFVLGLVCALLLTLPIVNFLAPFLGAAAATHLIHRKKAAQP